MKREFSNAKSASAQTSTCTKTHGVSKLLFAILLSVVLFGGAMFLLFANHTAPVSTALAANNLSTLPTSLDTAPTFTLSGSTLTGTGTDSASGYDFSQDVYTATTSTNKTIGDVTYPYVVTLKQYTSTTPTQVVIPSQIKIGENTYQVVIDCSSRTSSDPFFANRSVVTIISFAGISETKVLATNCHQMFESCSKLTSLNLSSFDTSNVTNMYSMFYECSSLTSLDLSNFNTGKVTDMMGMFGYCSSLTSLNLSSFDTSCVNDMNMMFTGCSSLTTLDLSRFNTANVNTELFGMMAMFADCSQLTSLDISNFNTSSVNGMPYMFSNCSSLRNLDLSSFDTSNVTDMRNMFAGCSSLTGLNLSNFNTSEVVLMNYTHSDPDADFMRNKGFFEGCTSLQTITFGENFTTANVEDMSYMFYNCSALKNLDLSGFNAIRATSTSNMFSGCSALTSLDLSNFYAISATNMESMFSYCGNLTSLDISNFEMSNVTNFNNMFYNCDSLETLKCTNMKLPANSSPSSELRLFIDLSSLKTLDLSNADTANVTNMSNMFFNCHNLTNLDVSSFDTSNVTSMVNMFCNCFALTSLDLSNFDTASVTNMGSMFQGCSNLSSITFGQKFDTSGVTAMTYMFEGCSALKNLDLSGFDTSSVTDMTMMFSGCSSLQSLNLSSFTFDSISSPIACIGMLGLNKVYLKNMIDLLGQDGETYANLVYPENGEPNAQVLAQLLVNLGFTSSSDTALTFANSLLATKIDKIIAPTNALNANAVIGLPGTYYNSADVESAGQYFLTNGTNLVLTTTQPVPSTGVATSLLFAVSGAVVVALFAFAVAHVGKRKRAIKK